MPAVRCPGCATRLTLSDDQFLKRIRCATCSMEFFPGGAGMAVSAPAAAVPKPKPAPVVVKKPVTVETPPPKPTARPKSTPQVHALPDEDEFEDKPEDVAALRGQFQRTRVALLLSAIGLWCSLAGVLMCCLFLVVLWSGDTPIEERNILVGFPSIIGCLCAAVGAGFALFGVQRERALPYAIGLAVAVVWHFVVVATIALGQVGTRSTPTRPRAPTPPPMRGMPPQSQPAPDFESPFALRQFMQSGSPKPLQLFSTSLPFVVHSYGVLGDRLRGYATLAIAFTYQVDFIGWKIGVLTILAGLADVARWVMLALWMRAVAKTAHAGSQEDSPLMIGIGVPAAIGFLFLVNLLIGAFAKPTTESGQRLAIHTLFALQLIQLIVIGAAATTAAVLMHQLHARTHYRKLKPAKHRPSPSVGGAF